MYKIYFQLTFWSISCAAMLYLISTEHYKWILVYLTINYCLGEIAGYLDKEVKRMREQLLELLKKNHNDLR